MIATAAIESNCGDTIKQIKGPALSAWMVEPRTHDSVWVNCDYLKKPRNRTHIKALMIKKSPLSVHNNLIISPMYACVMARLKYAMDQEALPPHNEQFEIYKYYKRIFNTALGASTFDKFKSAWISNDLHKINLGKQ